MNFLQRLFSKNKQKDAGPNAAEASNSNALASPDTASAGASNENAPPSFELKWLEAAENPFGARVFDCREYALKRGSTSKNPGITTKFFETRKTDGMEYLGKFPGNWIKTIVNLDFRLTGHRSYQDGIPDGILFKAQSMEQKWDIYKYAGFIFFVRSWTGELVYFCNYLPAESGFKTDLVVLDRSKMDEDDPLFEIRNIEFLLLSHVLDMQVPHPIPKLIKDCPEAIASYSFSMFGNRGLFAMCG